MKSKEKELKSKRPGNERRKKKKWWRNSWKVFIFL